MTTVALTKAALAEPPSRIVPGEDKLRGDVTVVVVDKEVTRKNTDVPNTGAIKKRKLVNSARSAEASSTSKSDKQQPGGTLQVPGQSNKQQSAPKKKLAKHAVKSPAQKHTRVKKPVSDLKTVLLPESQVLNPGTKADPKFSQHPAIQVYKPCTTKSGPKIQPPSLSQTSKQKKLGLSDPVLTDNQKEKLNLAWARKKEPGFIERRALARETKLTEFQVRRWFKEAGSKDLKSEEGGKKEVFRPHFLASKLVRPSDAKRHMDKKILNKISKPTDPKSDKQLKKSVKPKENVAKKTSGISGFFSSLKPNNSQGVKLKMSSQQKSKDSVTNLKKLNIPALYSMQQILLEMKSGGKDVKSGGKDVKSGDINDKSATSSISGSSALQEDLRDANKKPYEELRNSEVLLLDEVFRNSPEVIDIVDEEDERMLVEKVPLTDNLNLVKAQKMLKSEGGTVKRKQKEAKNLEHAKIFKNAGKPRSKLLTAGTNEQELEEKRKVVLNLEVKIPEMIAEFTKCVSDKDEVIEAKDKEIQTHKQKKADLEKELKLLHNRNKNLSDDLKLKVKIEETFKMEVAKNNKEKVDHLLKMDGLEAKVGKLLGVLSKKDEEISKLKTKDKELKKKDDELKKLHAKKKDLIDKLKVKEMEFEKKLFSKSQENAEKVRELEKMIKKGDNALKDVKKNDSIRSKRSLDSQQKQIIEMKVSIKSQEKEIQLLKVNESKLRVQVADLECDTYTKSAELECKNAELEKIKTKDLQVKSSDPKKSSIYEATKDYIEKLKENRKSKIFGGSRIENDIDGNESLERIVDDETSSIYSPSIMMIKKQPLAATGARPEVFDFVKGINQDRIPKELNVQPVKKAESRLVTEYKIAGVLSFSTDGFEDEKKHNQLEEKESVQDPHASEVLVVDNATNIEPENVNADVFPNPKVSIPKVGTQAVIPPLTVAGRPMVLRSATGVWGQVYRARGVDQGLSRDRVAKRKAGTSLGDGVWVIPNKKRKLEVSPKSKPEVFVQENYHRLKSSMVAHQVASICQDQPSTASHIVLDRTSHPSIASHTLLYNSGYAGYSFLAHQGTTAYTWPCAPIVSHSRPNIDKYSFLSHQLPYSSSADQTSSLSHQLFPLQPQLQYQQSYSFCSHQATTGQALVARPNIDKYSFLSHQLPYSSSADHNSSIFHQLLPLQPHLQYQQSYSFCSHQATTGQALVARPSESPVPASVSKQIISAILFDILTSYQFLPESRHVDTGESTWTEGINIVDPLTFLTHSVKEASSLSCVTSLLTHRVSTTTLAFNSFLSHCIVSTPAAPYSTQLCHKVSSHLPISPPYQVADVFQAHYETSILAHTVRNIHSCPSLNSSSVLQVHKQSKVCVFNSCKRALEGNEIQPTKRKKLDIKLSTVEDYDEFQATLSSSFVSHMVSYSPFPPTPEISFVSHYLAASLATPALSPVTGRQKRKAEDSLDRRKIVKLDDQDVLHRSFRNLKRLRDLYQDDSPPPKRLKMSKLCAITLHFPAKIPLSSLPLTKCDWQMVKFCPRKSLLDLVSTTVVRN